MATGCLACIFIHCGRARKCALMPPTGRNLSLRLSAETSTCGPRSLAASVGRVGLGLQSRQLWLVLATRVTRRRQVAVLDQALRPAA